MSIVVPVYRSEDCLEELVRQIDDALVEWPHEIVLVNDRSPDHSWDVIVKLAQANPGVTGINLRKNSGQDNAIMAGFRCARGKYVVVMDDDLQHDPADIVRLWHACEEHGADVCFGRFNRKKQAWWKNAGSWLNGKIAEFVIDKPPHVYLSPYKIIRSEVVAEIIKYDGPSPYVDGLLFTITDSVAQIDATHHVRFAGRSNYDFVRSLKVALKLATSFSVIPLRLASVLGFMTATVGFVLTLWFAFDAVVFGRPVQGWPSQMCVTLVLGGVTLLCVGLLGEYVGRTFVRLNNRPQYTIKDKISSGRGDQ
jgi:undecaprenyl-phosphate 4-deoxy-4-formamido-L-arabinose transferase